MHKRDSNRHLAQSAIYGSWFIAKWTLFWGFRAYRKWYPYEDSNGSKSARLNTGICMLNSSRSESEESDESASSSSDISGALEFRGGLVLELDCWLVTYRLMHLPPDARVIRSFLSVMAFCLTRSKIDREGDPRLGSCFLWWFFQRTTFQNQR